ncbi:penicillin-binding protein 1C [Corticimicrobacter populi]|uniref:peptidoglycan glycosyltransferase n=1 Tax=Corticimicrobacter populi TaxID=2175229 RepID=A0A2V1K326_9BURK|nr:penicillin-binding protein 1C [Corticimicrobacter populi]PWF23965.1 penicillin-binding protein 1C [Corticimicrobacter populi]
MRRAGWWRPAQGPPPPASDLQQTLSSRRRGWRWLYGVLVVAIVLGLVVVGVRLWPGPGLFAEVAFSRQVLAADGSLLRMTLAPDQQYREHVPLADIPDSMVQAMLLKEDRYFYWHPGINPVALLRAVRETYGGGTRMGASTVTMQLARRLYGLNTRTVGGKLQQMALALWLELRHGKDELLEAYLNLVPMGGNIEGVGAASRLYFGKPASRLSLSEALALAVMPQQPTWRSRSGAAQRRATEALLQDWLQAYPDDARNGGALALELPPATQRRLPFSAPHFSDHLLASRSDTVLQTTLSPVLQRMAETTVRQFVRQQASRGVRNATALLLDSRDLSVKAWVGSADYFDVSIHGQVDGIRARRSPGSTLKPFLYGLALDRGLIHPLSMLRDIPTAFGYFQPENFDGKFAGPLTARDALIRSRNIPAVWLANRLGRPGLHDLLVRAGVSGLREEAHYGLALALGGGELTPLELAQLYLALGRDGRAVRARMLQGDPATVGETLMSPGASFMVRDMLRYNPRPDGLPPDRRGAQWPVAWKTGTSWGFHDAWSAGLIGPYVLVVWVGNFDGRANPAFIGAQMAAPLFFRLADALAAIGPRVDWRDSPPQGVEAVQVCRASGDLPDRWCPQTVPSWFMPGVSPIRVSTLHRPVRVDAAGRAVCGPPFPEGSRLEVFEFWPGEMRRLFDAASVPRRHPPSLPACGTGHAQVAGDPPSILAPLQGVTYRLGSAEQEAGLLLRASADSAATRLYWFAGQSYLGQSAPGEGLAWHPPRSGAYRLRVSDDLGRSAERQVQVELGA